MGHVSKYIVLNAGHSASAAQVFTVKGGVTGSRWVCIHTQVLIANYVYESPLTDRPHKISAV